MRRLLVFLWLATWAYLCFIPSLESGSASYLAWREAGCPKLNFPAISEIPFCSPPHQTMRSFLLWIFTAPFLGWALWRTPRVWPQRITNFWWNKERQLLSVGSLALFVAVVFSIIVGAVWAPYAAAAVSNWTALVPVTMLALWYRAVLLSAPQPEI
ncbi:MAG: hypothetical protein EOP11_03570 [Proteobacteria bacterium]|nr:MAG: hypothetical protein EOP11_03570 [Pseudomonadota bacterium]